MWTITLSRLIVILFMVLVGTTQAWEYRLVSVGNFTGSNAGRLEVRPTSSSSWGTVCDDGFSIVDANVACRSLGFSHALGFATAGSSNAGTGITWMDDLACTGSESELSSCPFTGSTNENCVHAEDILLRCNAGEVITEGPTTSGPFPLTPTPPTPTPRPPVPPDVRYTCDAPYDLGVVTQPEQLTFRGDTAPLSNVLTGARCGTGGGAPEAIYKFTVPAGTVLRSTATVVGFEAMLVLMSGTCSYASAIDCNTNAAGTSGGASLTGDLPAGTYYLAVEGATATSRGTYTLTVAASPSNEKRGSKKSHTVVIVVCSVVGGVVFIIVCATIYACCCARRSRSNTDKVTPTTAEPAGAAAMALEPVSPPVTTAPYPEPFAGAVSPPLDAPPPPPFVWNYPMAPRYPVPPPPLPPPPPPPAVPAMGDTAGVPPPHEGSFGQAMPEPLGEPPRAGPWHPW